MYVRAPKNLESEKKRAKLHDTKKQWFWQKIIIQNVLAHIFLDGKRYLSIFDKYFFSRFSFLGGVFV
jgi:hypothetical protein